MTRRVNQDLWEQWRERMERQRESGLSIAEFCRREGVSAVTFYTWKRKLQDEALVRSAAAESAPGRRTAKASGAISPRRRPRPRRADAAARGGGANFLQLPVLGARSGPWIELTLVDGTIVRIPQQNLAALQTVFTILRGGAVAAMPGEVAHA
jgi:transposase-like protein